MEVQKPSAAQAQAPASSKHFESRMLSIQVAGTSLRRQIQIPAITISPLCLNSRAASRESAESNRDL